MGEAQHIGKTEVIASEMQETVDVDESRFWVGEFLHSIWKFLQNPITKIGSASDKPIFFHAALHLIKRRPWRETWDEVFIPYNVLPELKPIR